MAAVDNGPLRHGGNHVGKGRNQQGQQQAAGQYTRHRAAQISPQQTLQQPIKRQGKPYGHNGRAKHDHAATHLDAQHAQGRQRQQKKRTGAAQSHHGKAQQTKRRGFHPRMEVGKNLGKAQILHLNDGLRHRGIFQRKPATRAFYVARMLHIGINVVDDGCENFALQHQVAHARQQQGQQPRLAQQPPQLKAGLGASGQQ